MQTEKNQTILERKQQMGHVITRCPAFLLLESPFEDALWLLKVRYIDAGF